MSLTTVSSPWIRLAAIAALLMGAAACSDGGSSNPTSPASPLLVLQAATISINGQDVTNGSWNHGGRVAESTRFEGVLLLDGKPAIGKEVYVDFDRPGMGSMMGTQGRFQLYDDGTHGDHTPGDGIYCLEDFDMGYGFHHDDSAHGDYHYEYFGQDHQGYESNHMKVTVRVGG